jgi:hypothetical protein
MQYTQQLPWSHRPLLLRLVDYATLCLDEHYTAVNGLDLATLSHLLAPALLRPYQSQPSSSSISSNSSSSGVTTRQPHDGVVDEATAATAAVVACILQHDKVQHRFVSHISLHV